MSSRKLKHNNNYYYFNFTRFNDLFSKKKALEKIGVVKLEDDLAQEVKVSKEAVHNWRFKKNGPSDIELVKSIAHYFDINDISILLIQKEENMKSILNDKQVDSLKKVYDSIIDFLEKFYKTNGFNDIWFDLKEDPEYREDKLWEIATKEHEKVMLLLKKEFFYLKDTNAYDELEKYIYNDLYDIYDGKLSYAYRFEAIGDNNPTTSEDYTKALDKITDIISKYV